MNESKSMSSSSEIMISELEIMTSAENYRDWIYSQMARYLGQRIIEIGAGIGNFTELLLDRELVVTVDNDVQCLAYLQRHFSGRKNVLPVKGDLASENILSLGRYEPDTVVCINVLEHVKDDHAALTRMFRLLRPGGFLTLLVPAFPFAFGVTDRLVGHYRRYRKHDLRERLTDAGFEIHDLFYMNSLALFGWFLNNRILKRGEHAPSQVIFYDSVIIPWLRVIERAQHPPFGLSLVAIAGRSLT
jgi:SAM-dependent methyltransferase